MSTVDTAFVGLGLAGVALLALARWLTTDPAAKWANITGDDE